MESQPPASRTTPHPFFRMGRWPIALLIILTFPFAYWAFGQVVGDHEEEDLAAHFDALDHHRKATRAAPVVAPEAVKEPPGNWTRYRGIQGQGVSGDAPLAHHWPDKGPKEVFRHPVGGGFAGFVIGGGRAYTIEQRRHQEVVSCYDFTTGVEQWVHAYDALFAENLGGDGPRATPTLDGDNLYALGATGVLLGLDARTGEKRWERQILKDRKMENLQWGMSGSPLVLGTRVIVTTSGKEGPGVVAYDKQSGEVAWESLPARQGYASLFEARLAGRSQIVNLAGFALNGLDPQNGEVLWSVPWETSGGISCAQPLLAGRDRIFMSTAYGKGAALVQITDGKSMRAEKVWSSGAMKNKFNSSVIQEGTVYGLDEGWLAAVDLETGKRLWKGRSYGYGQLVVADGHLIVLGDDGTLALVEARADKFEERSSFQALTGKTWNVPALAGGKLLVRNEREMALFDLR